MQAVNKNRCANPFGEVGLPRGRSMLYIGPTMAEIRKVVQVMRRFAPDRWGGTESVVFQVSRALIGQGIESPIHCTAMLAPPGDDRLETVPIHRHRYVFPWFGLSRSDRNALRLKGGSPLSLPLFFALLRERNVSIVHVHVQHRLGGMARTAARLKRVPLVVSLHGGLFTLPREQVERMVQPFAGKPEWGKLFGALFGSRRVLDDADAIICVGQSEYDEVRRRYPAKNVFLVPNGVDVQRFARADGAAFRDAHGFLPSEKIVLCVSRIDYQKNQLGLVRAFARFAETHPDHRLVLLGPVTVEAYRDEVVAETDRLGIAGKVRLIEGFRPDDPMLPAAYKAAEMFVLPSLHEPFGIVVLEAWAAGLPVLASRIGGIPGFVVDRETALLADPEREDEWVALMAELAGGAALRAALAARASATVAAHYDWAAIVSRMLGIYRQLARERQGARSRKSPY